VGLKNRVGEELLSEEHLQQQSRKVVDNVD